MTSVRASYESGGTGKMWSCKTRGEMSRQSNRNGKDSEKNFQTLPLTVQRKTILARTVLILGVVLGLLPVAVRGQVAFDASTSGSGRLTSLANTLTVAHTSSGTNLVLVVGISMNISAG